MHREDFPFINQLVVSNTTNTSLCPYLKVYLFTISTPRNRQLQSSGHILNSLSNVHCFP